MKKQLLAVFSLILVFSMLLTSTGSATAAPLSGGPSISAPSGGGSVTLTTIPIAELPGIEKNDSGSIVPNGSAFHGRVFTGDGVKVSGLVGYATLSLPLKNYTYGWTGSIYQYLNGDWVILPTTITKTAESNDGTASATIFSNGIYALIVGYQQAANLHTSTRKPITNNACDWISHDFVMQYESGLILIREIEFDIFGPFEGTPIPIGSEVSMSFENFVGPTGDPLRVTPTSWKGVTTGYTPEGYALVDFGDNPLRVEISGDYRGFQITSTIKGCPLTFTWSNDIPIE